VKKGKDGKFKQGRTISLETIKEAIYKARYVCVCMCVCVCVCVCVSPIKPITHHLGGKANPIKYTCISLFIDSDLCESYI
jgi:hypothetical protein